MLYVKLIKEGNLTIVYGSSWSISSIYRYCESYAITFSWLVDRTLQLRCADGMLCSAKELILSDALHEREVLI